MIVKINNIGSSFSGVINGFEVINAQVKPHETARITVNFGEVKTAENFVIDPETNTSVPEYTEYLGVKDNREFELTQAEYDAWGLNDSYLDGLVVSKFNLTKV